MHTGDQHGLAHNGFDTVAPYIMHPACYTPHMRIPILPSSAAVWILSVAQEGSGCVPQPVAQASRGLPAPF